MLEDSVTYGRILLISLPGYMLQFEFQSFFVTAQKPQLGLAVTLICGVVNMVLDALFMAVFSWGLVGAAAATAVSQVLGGVIPVFYFARKISISIVSMLYNIQLMKYAGENGIAAYGVLMYINMIFLAIFIDYSNGTAPIVSYHYGAENHGELKNMLKRSVVITGIFAVCMFGLAELLAQPLAGIFVSYDAELMTMTTRAFRKA